MENEGYTSSASLPSRLLTTVVILDRFQRLISKECKNQQNS
eukprot:UN14108